MSAPVTAVLLAALLIPSLGLRAQEAPGNLGMQADTDAAAEQRYLANVAWLADDDRDGRGVGTDGLAEAAAWLADQFARLGLEPAGDEGSFLQAFPVRLNESEVDGRVEVHNVIGVIRARASDRLAGAIIIGAHYDHLGLGDQGSLAPDESAVHNGADDNASGTAALLEVARGLFASREDMRRDVILVAFSGEERGLLGSSMFVHAPPPGIDLGTSVAMLNMDMVGRLRNDRLSVLGGESALEWSELVSPLCAVRRLECSITGDGFGASDHSSFYAAGIPVLHFFTGAHPEYHRPDDDTALINARGGVRVARLVSDVALALAALDGRLTYVKAEPRDTGGRMASGGARLGTIPDYAGSPDGQPGVMLSAVRPGSPAERGGLQRGDRIVRIGDAPVAGVEDFMAVLQSATPGQKTDITVVREGEEVTLEVTYGARN